MLVAFITTIVQVLARPKGWETKFLDEFSLIPPHVGANGREDFFDFDNQYAVKTRSRSDFTQLGYNSKNSYGMLRSKKMMKEKNFDMLIEFSLRNVSKGGRNTGFGFWLTDTVSNGPTFYGRDPSFNGVGVVIDIESSPHIRFVDSFGTRYLRVPLKSAFEDLSLRFERKNGILQVKFNNSDKEHILYNGTSKIPRGFFLSITSFSGNSESTLQVDRILTSSIIIVNKPVYIKGEKRKMSKLVLIIGSACIIGLAYYLYQKSPKEMALKN